MVSPELLHTIQEELQAVSPTTTILLGGSYLYGEATDESDLDYYAICGVQDLLLFRQFKRRIEKVKDRYFHLPIHVMIVPRCVFDRGWYYIYGRDAKGAVRTSPINKKIIIRNALKLAYLHYIKFMLEKDARLKESNLTKATQQLAAAIVCAEKVYSFDSFFSINHLIAQLPDDNQYSLLIGHILKRKLYPSHSTSQDIDELGQELGRALHANTAGLQSWFLDFNLINYLMYNLRFLAKGDPLFLFSNPDKMVITTVQQAIREHRVTVDLMNKLNRIILPILII